MDAKKFTLSANGGKVFNLADNIELGNYNMMMESSILWNPMSNQDSHDIFRSALPGGFAWELTELLSGELNYVCMPLYRTMYLYDKYN